MCNIHVGFLIFASSTLMSMSSSAQSQHLLLKTNGTEYVGVRVSEDTFEACGEHKIPIEDGVISKTDRKCTKPPQLTAMLPEVVVNEIDLSSRTFKATIPNIGVKEFYFPEIAEKSSELSEKLNALKPGVKLNINAWKQGGDHERETVWVANDVRIAKPLTY